MNAILRPKTPCRPLRAIALLGGGLALSLAGDMSMQGQVRGEFRPVTQATLNNPDPAELEASR